VALPLKTFSHLSNDGNPLKAAYGNWRCSRAERIISGYVKKGCRRDPNLGLSCRRNPRYS
jgi:hypothetical protein